MRIFLFLCILSAGFSTFSGCSSRNKEGLKSRHFFDEIEGPDDYAEVFDDQTKEDRSHSEFQPVIAAQTTFWNSKLRESYVRERSNRFHLPAEEAKQLAVEELTENETYIVFLMSVATREYEWNKLDRKSSLWRISLEGDQAKEPIAPDRIQVISDKDEVAKYFYKYMTTFTRTYRVRFLRESLKGSEHLRLFVSGVRGSLHFEFQNDNPRPKAHLESQ